MFPYSIYERETGRVLRSGTCSMYRDVVAQVRAATEICLDVQLDPATHYVVSHHPVTRPKLLPKTLYTVDKDAVVAIDLMPGTQVLYEGQLATLDDGKFEFASPIPDEYEFTITPPFPAQVERLRVAVR